jgi:Ribosomal protein L36e
MGAIKKKSKSPRYEMAVGLNKGHKTTKIVWGKSKTADKKIKVRPSRLKGVSINLSTNLIQY